MGYTHYIYRPRTIQPDAWAKIMADTKTVFAFIQNELGIVLANGVGEGEPIIDDEKILFNGSSKQPLGVWTSDEEIVIPWPETMAGVNTPNPDPIARKTAGNWHAGTLLTQRVAPVRNGYGDGEYETAGLLRVTSSSSMLDGLGFDCCKTAFRPYDIAVVCFYAIVKHHVPECIVKSDGEESEWIDAMIINHNLLGYEMVSPLS